MCVCVCVHVCCVYDMHSEPFKAVPGTLSEWPQEAV